MERREPSCTVCGNVNWYMEKAMAPHSNTLAWKIPWMEEPGRLQSMGLLRVGCNWATSLSLFTFMGCRRKWQPTPVFLPGESQGQGSLVGCQSYGDSLKKTSNKTTSDPKIPLLGMNTEEIIIEKDTCTPKFIATLFTTARTWKQPRCPSTDEWIKNLWYICTMEYYLAIKGTHLNQF